MSRRTDAIHEKLSEKPLGSKKAIYALAGGLAVIVVFFGASNLILRHAEASHDIVELASLTIMFFGAVTTTLLTGVAAMDWKCISALQHIDETEEQHYQAQRSEMVDSNQPIENLSVDDSSEEPEQTTQNTEVFISGRRSPKDFLGNDLAL